MAINDFSDERAQTRVAGFARPAHAEFVETADRQKVRLPKRVKKKITDSTRIRSAAVSLAGCARPIRGRVTQASAARGALAARPLHAEVGRPMSTPVLHKQGPALVVAPLAADLQVARGEPFATKP